MPFSGQKTEWKQLAKCTSVNARVNCAVTEHRVHQGSGSCSPPAHKRLYSTSAFCAFVEVSTPFKFNKISVSGHQECLPCPDSWISRDQYRLSRQAAPQFLCPGPSVCSSPSKRPDRLVDVDGGFRGCVWRYRCRSRLSGSPDSTACCRK